MFIKQDFKDENLYFDISTLQLVSTKRLMVAISFVGAEKITLGSDTPGSNEISGGKGKEL